MTSWTARPSPRCSLKKCGLPAAREHRIERDPPGDPMVGVVVVAVPRRRSAVGSQDSIGLGADLAHPAHHGLADLGRVLQLAVVGRQDPDAGEAHDRGRGLGLGRAGRRQLGPRHARGRSSRGRRSSGPADAPRGRRPPSSPACRRRRSPRRRDGRRPRGPGPSARSAAPRSPSQAPRDRGRTAPAPARARRWRRAGPRSSRALGERRPGDVQVHPRRVADELGQEPRRRDRAALAVADVLDVGHLRVDQRAVVLPQGHLPDRLADGVSRRRPGPARGTSSLPNAPGDVGRRARPCRRR